VHEQNSTPVFMSEPPNGAGTVLGFDNDYDFQALGPNDQSLVWIALAAAHCAML
jgi:hypothetical protein